MAIQTLTIDPNATDDQTGDEIIAAIDAGAASITREDALDQDSLKIVKTNPVAGEFQIKNIHLDSSSNVEVEYDDVAEV